MPEVGWVTQKSTQSTDAYKALNRYYSQGEASKREGEAEQRKKRSSNNKVPSREDS